MVCLIHFLFFCLDQTKIYFLQFIKQLNLHSVNIACTYFMVWFKNNCGFKHCLFLCNLLLLTYWYLPCLLYVWLCTLPLYWWRIDLSAKNVCGFSVRGKLRTIYQCEGVFWAILTLIIIIRMNYNVASYVCVYVSMCVLKIRMSSQSCLGVDF